MHQQIVTFEELFPHVQPHGVYLCEDLHTSYVPPTAIGGGLPQGWHASSSSPKSLVVGLHGLRYERQAPASTRPARRIDFTRSAHSHATSTTAIGR